MEPYDKAEFCHFIGYMEYSDGYIPVASTHRCPGAIDVQYVTKVGRLT